MSAYDPEKVLRIPTDTRIWIAALWVASITLLAINSMDMVDNERHLGVWGIFFSLAATSLTMLALHSYSRRVILEVMSWEHRQQMSAQDTHTTLALIRE